MNSRNLILVLLTCLSANVYAHNACEIEAVPAFIEQNQTELFRLANQTSSTLSNEGRMLLAVTSLRSGVSIAEINRLESEVPYVIGQSSHHMLNGEERAMIASAAVELETSTAEVMGRIVATSVRLPTKLRILVGISSLRNGTDVAGLSRSAEAVYDARNN